MKRIIIMVAAIGISACGGGGSPGVVASPEVVAIQGDANEIATSSRDDGTPRNDNTALNPRATYWEPLLRSESYTGQLAVMFQESAGVRLRVIASEAKQSSEIATSSRDGGTPRNDIFRSKTNTDISVINQLFAAHPEVTITSCFADIPTDVLDERVQAIRLNEGYPMTDWGSCYYVHVMDADEALEVLSGLYQLSETLPPPASPTPPYKGGELVWFAHPVPMTYPATISIPSVTPGQDYLKSPSETGGVNVKAAWDAGLDGTGVIVEDIESNWNINHLDLPLSEKNYYAGSAQPNASKTELAIQHGTAVAGVLVGKDNGIGITGMVPNAKIYLGQLAGGLPVYWDNAVKQSTYADGNPKMGGFKPGDTILIEYQTPKPGAESCGGTSADPLTPNCVPVEAYKVDQLIIRTLTDYAGYVVVEAAGNGGLDLDDPKNHLGFDMAKDPSGAIMVGASMGGTTTKPWSSSQNHAFEKAPFSNCGARIDVFAWGAGVVTTGYGDHPISVKNDPNQSYTQSFAGTSSATAIIGGAAALLQQYARQLYTDPKSACAIVPWKYVYLSSQQMRDVMVKSGTPAKDYVPDAQLWNGLKDAHPGCNIGMQPDLAKAMQIIKDGCEGKPGGVVASTKPKDTDTYCPKPTLSNPNPKQADWCQKTGPIQPEIGKMMDLDGDGRADLISFSRDRKWRIDLSSMGPTILNGVPLTATTPKDNFGTWNLTFDLNQDTKNPIPQDAMLFPVVMDYNTDGKADLGLYDSISGKWYIHFTTGNTLNTKNLGNGANVWPGWDMVIDYSTQPKWKPYSRPVPGDYNGQDKDPLTYDHYMDLGLQTPDGWWLIDLGGSKLNADYGAFEEVYSITSNGTLTYNTSATNTKTLTDIPSWAYLPVLFLESYSTYQNKVTANVQELLKIPDNISDESSQNRLLSWWITKKNWSLMYNKNYGDNDAIFVQARAQTKVFADIGIKKHFVGSKGDVWLWQLATDNTNWDDLIYVDPYVNFGGLDCRPIPADYDGDNYDDRAVLCSNGEWRIAFSGSKYPKNNNVKNVGEVTIPDENGKEMTVTVNEVYRKIVHTTVPQDALPGFVYPGGVSYKETKAIFETVNYLCPTVNPTGNNPPCSLMTMTPPPISPYFPQCVDAMRKLYKTDPCLDPAQKVACETLRIQQAQCVWEY